MSASAINTNSINIYAGKSAREIINKEGFHSDLFEGMAGASGGPKWFTLFGLDKFIFGDFFADRKEPLRTIGSSAGAWRMSCFAQKDPVAAIERLAHFYSNETYSAKPTVDEISDKANVLLKNVLRETGAEEIAQNPIIQTHFILAKAKGLNASEKRTTQLMGLGAAALSNAISRDRLAKHFERVIVYTNNESFSDSFYHFDDYPTQNIPLKTNSVHSTLMATGAIPLVLRGIESIDGAPAGMYRDGGIIDYHLDLDLKTDGLILYPHFFPILKPGWFDKGLKSRKAQIKNYDKIVLVTPSEEHVKSLPFQKISDRKDFEKLDAKTRIDYWQTVLSESHKMADDFKAFIQNKSFEQIIPIESIL